MNSHVATVPPANRIVANIRHASRLLQRQFLAADPPPPISPGTVIPREAANVPDWYVPWARHFLPLTDEFVAHATGCAPYKRLPRGWRVDKPGDVFELFLGRHRLCVIGCDHGWLIERNDLLNHADEQVLTHIWAGAPVVCPTYVTAARLAEAAQLYLGALYMLGWQDL
jgi:hypothetical protein